MAALQDTDGDAESLARSELRGAAARTDELREEAKRLVAHALPGAETKDADYIFIGFVLATIALEFYRGARARMKTARESFPAALAGLITRNKRRYGGYLVHVGMVMIFVGIAGSSAFQQEQVATLRRGESFRIGPYELVFSDTSSSRDDHKDVLSTTLAVSRNGEPVTTLRPEVNDVVRVEHDVEVVLDDHDGVATVGKALQYVQQVADVLEAQARRRLVQDVEGLARGAAG